jgi:hypothetical protein
VSLFSSVWSSQLNAKFNIRVETNYQKTDCVIFLYNINFLKEEKYIMLTTQISHVCRILEIFSKTMNVTNNGQSILEKRNFANTRDKVVFLIGRPTLWLLSWPDVTATGASAGRLISR